jgi:hypothetical protein
MAPVPKEACIRRARPSFSKQESFNAALVRSRRYERKHVGSYRRQAGPHHGAILTLAAAVDALADVTRDGHYRLEHTPIPKAGA